jgi:phage FluMu protein Com
MHGDFEQQANVHMRGSGCPKCGDIKIGNALRKTKKQFVSEAIVIHKQKYNYDNFLYIDIDTKGEIFCNDCFGVFLQRPYSHLTGNGCPHCNGVNKTSTKETAWLDYLHIKNDAEHRQVLLKIPGRKYIIADGYSPETNTVYEFYGDFWHGNPDCYDADHKNKFNKKAFGELYNKIIERQNLIKMAGHNHICIWENEWDDIVKSIRKEKESKNEDK